MKQTIAFLLTLSLISCTPQKVVDIREPVKPDVLQHIDHHIPGHETVEGTIDNYDSELNRAVIGELFIDLTNLHGIDFNSLMGRTVMVHGFRTTENEELLVIAYSLTTID